MTTTVTLKLNYLGEYRRVAVELETTRSLLSSESSSIPFSFLRLEDYAKQLFPSLSTVSTLLFAYIDDENDRVIISSDLELGEALRTMRMIENGYLRFDVLIPEEHSIPRQSESIKPSSSCIECHSPLSSIFYKCSVRSNYEICQNCEQSTIQPHPMIKFYEGQDSSSNQIIVAINLTDSLGSSQLNPNFHHGIRCNECWVSPIPDIRYKCTKRERYDLCPTCERKSSQPYPMVKIYSFSQCPDGLDIYSTAEDSPEPESAPGFLQGFIQQIFQSNPRPQFPPEDACKLWRERARAMHSKWESAQANGQASNSHPCWGKWKHHRGGCHGMNRSNCGNSTASEGTEENDQLEEDLISITLQQSLDEINSTTVHPSAPSAPYPDNQSSQTETKSDDTHERSPLSGVSDEEIWFNELGLLRAMGFVNDEITLPLLKEHLQTPIGQGFPNPERMQSLIFTLLSNV